nr:hypothetical protein [Aromatoleum diolicum]
MPWAPSARAAEDPDTVVGVTIRVAGEGWGSAERDEIETVLQAVANELVTGPAPMFAAPIVVSYAAGSPVTLYERGAAGEYQVHLSARDRRWAQYVYQFGHELCHIMSNFEVRAANTAHKRNQWFEEAVCETAGLFALRRMAARWQTEAPYPTWQDYAPALRAYADRLVGEAHRHLPEGVSPGRWLHARLETLGSNPYRRSDNEVVANLLLPLFERAPEQWAALHHLNLHPDDSVADLPQYLRNWRGNAPRDHQQFIDELAGELGLGDVTVSARAQSAAAITPPPSRDSSGGQAGNAGPLHD